MTLALPSISSPELLELGMLFGCSVCTYDKKNYMFIFRIKIYQVYYSLSVVTLYVLYVHFRPAAARKFVEEGVKTLEGLCSICLKLKLIHILCG